jgi:prevent-host-death family protein
LQLTATEFKAKCLSLIDQVHEEDEPVIITKHGKVVAKLVGASTASPIKEIREKLAGSVKSYIDPRTRGEPLCDLRCSIRTHGSGIWEIRRNSLRPS